MNIKQKSILIALVIYLLPSIVFGEDKALPKTGYDLYVNIKLEANAKSVDQLITVSNTLGYLNGYIDGLVMMRDLIFNSMFPPEILSEKERYKLAKEMNFPFLNTPTSGLHTGQVAMIYKKYAEKHPEELNQSARLCLFLSILNAYGWK